MPTNVGFYGWTVPDEFDPPDGPVQFTELVNDITGTVKSIDDRLTAVDARLAVVELPPLLRSRKAVAQSMVSTSAQAIVTYPLKDEDPLAMTDAGGTNVTIKKAGIWSIVAHIIWAANVTGPRWIDIRINGAIHVSSGWPAISNAGWTTAMVVTALPRLALNDVVAVYAAQLSGVALDITSGSLSMVWRRP